MKYKPLKNKLDKTFGAVGMSAGLLLMVAGAAITFFSLTGLVLLAMGALVGLTYTATLVDINNKRMKFTTYLFGIIPLGKWIHVESGMSVGVRNWKTQWRTYSAGNRTLDLEERDFRIVLYDIHGKILMPLKKFQDREMAEAEAKAKAKAEAEAKAKELSKRMGIELV